LTNIRAPFVISRLVGSRMASAGGGVIVNISSGMGRLPGPPSAADLRRIRSGVNMGYGISKASLDRFSAAIAAELFGQRIAVITIYPPLTLLERLTGRADLDLMGAQSPEVTAKAVSFVCRDAMAFTGRFLSAHAIVERHRL